MQSVCAITLLSVAAVAMASHFANSNVHHDTTFYQGTPAAITSALRGKVEGQGYVVSLGVRTRF